MNYRLAAVSFLNTVPLIEGLRTPGDNRVDLVLDLPSRLGGLLRDAQAHAALLPVVEVFRGDYDGILWGAGIACRGEVGSVKLFLTGAPGDLMRIRADRGSRSSVALTRLLLREHHGLEPEIVEVEPDLKLRPSAGEALLVIGDRCFAYEAELRNRGETGITSLDLGRQWLDLTGLPFVFAAWTLAPGAARRLGADGVSKLRDRLNEARTTGTAMIDQLARREADRGRLGRDGRPGYEAIRAYFTDLLRFELGAEEMAGLTEFHRLCLQHGLVPDRPLPEIIGG